MQKALSGIAFYPDSGALASAKGSSAEKGKLIVDTAVEKFVKIIRKYSK